jgi:hypothetical protein
MKQEIRRCSNTNQLIPIVIRSTDSFAPIFCPLITLNTIIRLPQPIIIVIMALQPFVGPWPLFQCLHPIYKVWRTSWTGDQPVARPLPTHRATQTENKRTQTSMTWAGFEPTIPAFELEKTVHALDRAATVTGSLTNSTYKNSLPIQGTAGIYTNNEAQHLELSK